MHIFWESSCLFWVWWEFCHGQRSHIIHCAPKTLLWLFFTLINHIDLHNLLSPVSLHKQRRFVLFCLGPHQWIISVGLGGPNAVPGVEPRCRTQGKSLTHSVNPLALITDFYVKCFFVTKKWEVTSNNDCEAWERRTSDRPRHLKGHLGISPKSYSSP